MVHLKRTWKIWRNCLFPGAFQGAARSVPFSPPRTQDSSTSNLSIMDQNWNAPLSFSSERYVPEGRDPAGPKSLCLSLGPAEQRFLKAVGLESGKCHTILHAVSPTATSLDGALILWVSGSQLTLCPATPHPCPLVQVPHLVRWVSLLHPFCR